ncbi:MAG: pyridoxamine 5'-phosphate oxidase family protein [Pseudonocardiaceae bacterium]
MRYEREFIDAILDEAPICHLGFVSDGTPRVLPTVHARIGTTLYLHASSGGGPALLARDGGLDVCVTVTLLDGIVLARSAFHHSMNYRSVVMHGCARLVVDSMEKTRALEALIDHVVAGRSAGCRPPTPRELDGTAVLALEVSEASMKARSGDPQDESGDMALPAWAGVLPLRVVVGDPVPSADLRPGATAVPDHVDRYIRDHR